MGSNEHRKESPDHLKSGPAKAGTQAERVLGHISSTWGNSDSTELQRLKTYLHETVIEHLATDERSRMRFHGMVVDFHGAKEWNGGLVFELPETLPFRFERSTSREKVDTLISKWLKGKAFSAVKRSQNRACEYLPTLSLQLASGGGYELVQWQMKQGIVNRKSGARRCQTSVGMSRVGGSLHAFDLGPPALRFNDLYKTNSEFQTHQEIRRKTKGESALHEMRPEDFRD
ncbi:MAG: hypothetical protein VXY14_03215 [Candidatus Thermoplasmatota archaeon]|nr:hypothetical protein [Candidatus Thermoplasmatota archaeon]